MRKDPSIGALILVDCLVMEAAPNGLICGLRAGRSPS
jgi:hypothetical protein